MPAVKLIAKRVFCATLPFLAWPLQSENCSHIYPVQTGVVIWFDKVVATDYSMHIKYGRRDFCL